MGIVINNQKGDCGMKDVEKKLKDKLANYGFDKDWDNEPSKLDWNNTASPCHY